MKVLFSSNKNPHFETFTDYIEKAFKENGCETIFFENRDFIIPGRIREKLSFLHKWDLQRMNKRLLDIAWTSKPDLFLEDGGWNILPDTIEDMKKFGIKTALWTNDAPLRFTPIIKSASHYDFVFTAGTEAIEILKKYNIKNLQLLPFACDPDFHKPVDLTQEDIERYESDVCFVGSGTPLYIKRRQILENLTDFNLGVWGPGWHTLPSDSKLKKFIKGEHTKYDDWIKIYSASKIVLCIHFYDPTGKIPFYQASPRVFEILSCGAFLICDKQKDVLSLFKSGEEFVGFETIEELKKLIIYYLNHPDEAKSIAEKGRNEVLKKHTYRHRIKDIINTIMPNVSKRRSLWMKE